MLFGQLQDPSITQSKVIQDELKSSLDRAGKIFVAHYGEENKHFKEAQRRLAEVNQ